MSNKSKDGLYKNLFNSLTGQVCKLCGDEKQCVYLNNDDYEQNDCQKVKDFKKSLIS